MGKSYRQGMIDAIEMWGTICGNNANCENCLIGAACETGITCQEFARRHPSKMISILEEMKKGETTYYNEYSIRFPNSKLSVEELSDCCCRKAVFEGYTECEGGNCVECWNDIYSGDVTELSGDD